MALVLVVQGTAIMGFAPPSFAAGIIASAAVRPRAGRCACWEGETSASIEIRAPQQLLLDAYADIERMPQWAPMLANVELVDPVAMRSEWALRVPRPLRRLVKAAGFEKLVEWEAVHEVENPRVLRWRSLSGVRNAGEATFEPSIEEDGCTTVTLTMTYSLPDVPGLRPVVENSLAQRFVRRTILSTMERFRVALEAQAAMEPEAAQVPPSSINDSAGGELSELNTR